MTPYTLTDGVSVVRDPDRDDVIAVDDDDVTLALVVPDYETAMSYTVNPLGPDDEPGDETVDIAVEDYTVCINGTKVGEGQPADPETSILRVRWDDAGVIRTSILLIAYVENDPISGGGVNETDYIFVLNGAPLPPIDTIQDWLDLEGSVKGIKVPDAGPYRPGVDIPLTSLGASVTENDHIVGTSAADVFNSGAGRDVVDGMGGNDTLNGGGGRDTLNGGRGNDRLNGGNGNDTLNGQGGSDTLLGGNKKDMASGGKGNDTIRGGKGNDTVKGDGGSDIVRGDNGNDTVLGGAGGDMLYGGKGRDTIKGGNGKDTIDGGAGDDTITGGGKSDTFVCSLGDDTITDFKPSDRIDLSGVDSIRGFRDLRNNHTEDAAGDLVIYDLAGNTLTLIGISEADLQKDDFIF
jgi:Ca2+-binding RTX toxin-like protein